MTISSNSKQFSLSLISGFFAAMMALQFIPVWIFLPETKGILLEKMEGRLGAH